MILVRILLFLFTAARTVSLLELFTRTLKKKLHGLSPRANYTDRATAGPHAHTATNVFSV
jgi:hypothetical protein